MKPLARSFILHDYLTPLGNKSRGALHYTRARADVTGFRVMPELIDGVITEVPQQYSPAGELDHRVHADNHSNDWWRHAVVYEIYPRSFADSNGDGAGDLRGVRSRLAYLAHLGVDAIWFNPFFTSPLLDGGYDVIDYRDIDPVFGDMAEVEALIADCHSYGLKVIIDVVPNHSSWEHRWFKEALTTEPGSAAWARYHCVLGKGVNHELPPNNWRSVFGGNAWSPIKNTDGTDSGYWYLHIFDSSQPDLNWDHPDVHQEFEDTLRFWFDRGVDGFRIDVSHGLVKAAGYPDYPQHADRAKRSAGGEIIDFEPLPHWDQDGVHEIYRAWRRVANEYEPMRAFVGEVWVDTAQRRAKYLQHDELHLAFNFGHVGAKWDALDLRERINEALLHDKAVGAPTTWVLENHDVPRVVTRYAGVELPKSSGDGDENESADDALRRLAVLTPEQRVVGTRRARAANIYMLSLPGSAYLYNGQELGLFEVVDLPPQFRQDPVWFRTEGKVVGRDGCRVPMPWRNAAPAYGFGPDGSTESWLPQPSAWGALSVQEQQGRADSMLELIRAAVHARKSHEAFGETDFIWRDDIAEAIAPGRSDVLVSEHGGAGNRALVVLVIGTDPVDRPDGELLVASQSLTETHIPGETCAWFSLS